MFWKKKKSEEPLYPPEVFEPVIRSSICTGEKVACMRDRKSGKIHELMLIQSDTDLKEFRRKYHVDAESIRTIY